MKNNYDIIYNNANKNIIINIAKDYVSDGKFPEYITIIRSSEKIDVKYREWLIFSIYSTAELNDGELLIKMLDYIHF